MESTLLFQSYLKSLTFCNTCYFWVQKMFSLRSISFLSWKVHKNHKIWWGHVLSVRPLLVLFAAAGQFPSMYIENSDYEHWATNNLTVVRSEHCEKLEQWYRLNFSLKWGQKFKTDKLVPVTRSWVIDLCVFWTTWVFSWNCTISPCSLHKAVSQSFRLIPISLIMWSLNLWPTATALCSKGLL